MSLRFFIGAVAAVKATGDAYEFEPFCLLAPTIEDVARDAQHYSYKRWPVADGFHDHSAVITPIPKGMYDMLGNAAALGHLDVETPETNYTFFRFKGKVEGEVEIDWDKVKTH